VLLVVDTPLPVSQAVLHPHQELHAGSMHHLLVITKINPVSYLTWNRIYTT
jgi:hypothetical protein